jgi:hypothetical protein
LTGGGLTVVSASTSNTSAATGTFVINNIGAVTSATPGTNLKVSFYFSPDATFGDANDLFLGNQFITPTQGISGSGSFTGSYDFSLFDTDPSVRSEFVTYWAARGSVGAKVSGFIGMIIDPSALILDANRINNKNQGVNKDRVAIDVTIAAGTTT